LENYQGVAALIERREELRLRDNRAFNNSAQKNDAVKLKQWDGHTDGLAHHLDWRLQMATEMAKFY